MEAPKSGGEGLEDFLSGGETALQKSSGPAPSSRSPPWSRGKRAVSSPSLSLQLPSDESLLCRTFPICVSLHVPSVIMIISIDCVVAVENSIGCVVAVEMRQKARSLPPKRAVRQRISSDVNMNVMLNRSCPSGRGSDYVWKRSMWLWWRKRR